MQQLPADLRAAWGFAQWKQTCQSEVISDSLKYVAYSIIISAILLFCYQPFCLLLFTEVVKVT